LVSFEAGFHGLTPVATCCRPFRGWVRALPLQRGAERWHGLLACDRARCPFWRGWTRWTRSAPLGYATYPVIQIRIASTGKENAVQNTTVLAARSPSPFI